MTRAADHGAWLLIVLFFVVLPAAIGFWAFAVPVYRAYRMRLAGAKADSIDACPACGNENLAPLAPHVLRCTKCGILVGSGVADWRRLRRSQSTQKASAEERLAAAVTDLREARLILMTAQSLLNDAASRSKWDIAGLSMDRGRAKQSSFGAAVRNIRNAEDLAKGAFGLLSANRLREPLELDTNPILMEADTAWLTDGLIPNVLIHRHIDEAHRRTSRMLERIEAALASLGATDCGASKPSFRSQL